MDFSVLINIIKRKIFGIPYSYNCDTCQIYSPICTFTACNYLPSPIMKSTYVMKIIVVKCDVSYTGYTVYMKTTII